MLRLMSLLLACFAADTFAQRSPPSPALRTSLDSKNLTFVVSAKGLPSLDALAESDPFVKVYDLNANGTAPGEEFGKTEVVEDSPSPAFIKVFSYQWARGGGQRWNFKVRDEDAGRPDEEIGEATVNVDDYVAKGEKLTVKLSQGGELTVQKTSPVQFSLSAKNLPPGDAFNGLSDPYVKCYWRIGSNGDNMKFHSTAVLTDVANADWAEVIEFSNYIRGTDQWLVFRVKDSDLGGDDDLGEALLEVDPFVEKRQAKELKLGKDGKATLTVTPV